MSIWSALVRDPTKTFVEPATSASATRHVMGRLPPRPLVATTPVPPRPVAAPARTFDGNPWHLAPMQWKVLAAVSLSKKPRREIAEELGISEHTMDVHLLRMRKRLGVQTTAAAVAMWLRVNIEADLESRRAAAEASLIEKLRRR